MDAQDLESLNADLMKTFGWLVEVSEQQSQYEPPGLHPKLFRFDRPGQLGSKRTYLGPMPLDMPGFAIHNADWLCLDYYRLGHKQGRRDEGRMRRKKRTRGR